MKKLIRFIILGVLIIIVFGSLNTQVVKDIYAKIWLKCAPENVNVLIDKGAELSGEIAVIIKESGVVEELKDGIGNLASEISEKTPDDINEDSITIKLP